MKDPKTVNSFIIIIEILLTLYGLSLESAYLFQPESLEMEVESEVVSNTPDPVGQDADSEAVEVIGAVKRRPDPLAVMQQQQGTGGLTPAKRFRARWAVFRIRIRFIRIRIQAFFLNPDPDPDPDPSKKSQIFQRHDTIFKFFFTFR